MEREERFPRIQVRQYSSQHRNEDSISGSNTLSTRELPTVERPIRHASSQLNVLNNSPTDIEATAEVARGKIEELERLRHENDALRQKLDQALEERARDVKSLEVRLESSVIECEELKSQCGRLTESLEQGELAAEQIGEHNKQLKEERDALYYENGLLRAALGQATRHFADYQAKFDSIMLEMNVLYGKLSHAEHVRSELERENQCLIGAKNVPLSEFGGQRLADANTAIQRLKVRTNELEAELREAHSKIAGMEADALDKAELRRQIKELKSSEAKCLDIIKSNVMIMNTMRQQTQK